jgi:hypothetical protein
MSRTTRIALICAGTLFTAMLLTVAVAVRSLTLGVQRSREAELFNAIVTIQSAQVEYYADFEHYAASLQELAPAANGTGGYIEPDLASVEKGGYKFTLTSTPTGYTISAVRGGRTYFSDQTMKTHLHVGPEPATLSDPVMGGSTSTFFGDPPEIRPPGAPTPQPHVPASSEHYSYPAPARHRTQSQSS